MVLRKGGDLAQVETFYSPQKVPLPHRQLFSVSFGRGIAVLLEE